MTTYKRNSGEKWSKQDIQKLRDLAKKNTPTPVIGLILGRSEESIYTKASSENINLKPTNQSPYNRRKK